MEFNTEFRLDNTQYMHAPRPKDYIFLHHTVGGSAESTFHYWNRTPERIGTSYVIGRDGVIYEVYPPGCWAYHLGLRGTAGFFDQYSIGIELASEGALLDVDDRVYAFDRVSERTDVTGEDGVYEHKRRWRGYQYFMRYTPEQVAAMVKLIEYLCETYRIPNEFQGKVNEWGEPVYQTPHTSDPLPAGIYAHANVRKDKTDLHPGFPWRSLNVEPGS